MPIDEPALGRESVCLTRGRAEPVVPARALIDALAEEDIERFRPLLPVGYQAGLEAYRGAVAALEVADLSEHYTRGLAFFHDAFVPVLRRRLEALSGGVWNLEDFEAFAAGSDVDLIAHIIEGSAPREGVRVYPGDWYGFRAGSTHAEHVTFGEDARGCLAACCVPSVRNGHLTEEMVHFLSGADASLLNINLFPTLTAEERRATAKALAPLLDRAMLSISFSRGFGLTASQLGVVLVHRDHPLRARFLEPWRWLTYFYNAIAARAFMTIDLDRLAAVDQARRGWVRSWLEARGLPALTSGSYYVRTFRPEGPLPERLAPLTRDGRVRLCMKPPIA